ncbi:UDP-glucose--hexose-1-phosphate uridylyltransferase [Proteiniclasticum sp.]|uniref:UDP-glucose--hexose-1-phosphate uridylyltransferase n=1 Tax=Proteiniclasticum sp. TaxID=2053595 RepID=UPI0028A230A2|nr:UDP-glucose--hexose-1-phosphate uridylyltransferase [Proteiniclasticum sp.]
MNINNEIASLVDYAVRERLIENEDRVYAVNRILEILNLEYYSEGADIMRYESVEDILAKFRQWAVETEFVPNDSNEVLDLFDTKLMSVFVSKPSDFRKKYYDLREESPEKATHYYYHFAKKSNYIREQRVAKDIKWTYETPYGLIDMTINLSKPEKDPRAIALASKGVNTENEKYPKCLLCKENEGYAGRLDHPARQNHRIIPITLADESWFMQYSPYVYYNEHCIVFKGNHEPMKISGKTIERLLDFVSAYPHYMIGSNADLPIVGGSILTHDHFQGGRYEFAMSKAKEYDRTLLQENGVELCKLYWPMSVIRLKGKDVKELVRISELVLSVWKTYEDQQVGIISKSGDIEHNTITPITRFRGNMYEVDLILRNNRTDEEHPFGIFHSQKEYHHIKRENIGLIECLGLAVLPARLRDEMELLKQFMFKKDLDGIYSEETLQKHGDFAQRILGENQFTSEEEIEAKLYDEIGYVFMKVLENCGVFKKDNEGEKAFQRFIEVIHENLNH